MPEITINPDKMPYSPPHIECLRFGGRLGGQGIGTCAIDIMQGFGTDPEAEVSVPLTNGDSLTPLTKDGKRLAFVGTNEEVFLNYLRTGTFDKSDLKNHAFIASIAESQLSSEYTQAWLRILKANGFEFIRAVDNSVYSGDSYTGTSPVYIFGLFRNIGKAAIDDPFRAPEGWDDLPEPKSQQELWDARDTVHTPLEAERKANPFLNQSWPLPEPACIEDLYADEIF